MKVLVIYSSRNGASKRAAEMLTEHFGSRAEAALYDINDAPPSPADFDACVIGGSVRFGKLSKKLKKYISTYKKELAAMPAAAFICCGFVKDYEDYAVMQLPRDLEFSRGVHCFGGELKPDKLKGLDKLIVKVVRESIRTQDPDKADDDRHELPELMPDTIYALAEQLISKAN